MGLTEIVLIVVGVVFLILSYVLPMGKGENMAEAGTRIDEGLIRSLVEKEVGNARNHINDMVDETLSYSMEKTERAMERLTNEKIMAVNEYSEQVLEGINKNHQEVIFLYDMLNDKHEKFVRTVGEADRKMKEIRQEVQDLEITVKEASGGLEAETEQKEEEKTKEGILSKPEKEEKREEVLFVPFAPEKANDPGKVLKEAVPRRKEEAEAGAADAKKEEPAKKKEQNYNNNERILRLHKLGKSKTAIARELGLGVGEVKLVIDLFEQAK